MAVEFKDYYQTLGVPRGASEADIKKAFRKLARQYHPDVAKDKKSAEARFKEINEANEVLSDPEKRRKYDQLGANWQSGGFEAPPGASFRRGRPGNGTPQGEYSFGGTGFSDFFEQFFGGGGGRGADIEELLRNARRGQAGGGHETVARGSDIEGDILVTLHEAMHGSTRSLTLQRAHPHTGEEETETFKVRIPPGALDGRRIRVRGKGGPGSGGAEAGDLYLRVRLAAHPDFEVRGSDLHHELNLAPWEAVLGTQVVVPTLAGNVKLTIPPGTNSGRQFRIRGQGLPRNPEGDRGDLYAAVQVEVPTQMTDEERALWEKLARTSRFNPRQADSAQS
jgi:curved DNA-binding protein